MCNCVYNRAKGIWNVYPKGTGVCKQAFHFESKDHIFLYYQSTE